MPPPRFENGRTKFLCGAWIAAIVLGVAAHGVNLHAASAVVTEAPKASDTIADAFPDLLPLPFEITRGEHVDLNAITELTVTVQRNGDDAPVTLLGPSNPFARDNTCANPVPAGIARCVVNGDRSAGTLTVNWQVPQAGSYRFVISARRGASGKHETLAAFDLQADPLAP